MLNSSTLTTLSEFSGLLRIVRVDHYSNGSFKATCTAVDEVGNILDRNGLYYLHSTLHVFERFVDEGQIWNIVKGHCNKSELITANGYIRIANAIEPIQVILLRPAGKHLIWHFTHSDWYPGIGKNKATSLINTLSNNNGHESLYSALDNKDKDALSLAPQITTWDADVLISGWVKHGSTDTLKWFEEKNIPLSLAKKVFDFHGENTIKAVEEDPYRLASFNMSWAAVDELALVTFNVERTDNRRLQAAVTEALWGAFNDGGHTKIAACHFVPMMVGLLGEDVSEWVKAHITMIDESRGIIRDNYIHMYEAAVMEVIVANRIADLASKEYEAPISVEKIESIVKAFEVMQKFTLTDQQKRAISTSVSNRFSIITGGAGVGKTTVLKALYALYDAAGFTRIQLALSGRAAQRMYEATLEDASTIAGFLYHFNWDDLNLEQQQKTVLIIDETSMVDIHSMYRIVDKTPAHVHLILIGDPYQLAPVGAGLVLHELVEKKYLPISKLSVVKRQGNHSSIPKVAESIRNGQVPKVYGDNVEFHNVDKSHLADKAILEYVKFPKESQILCATNKLVSEVNKKAQALLNPNEAEVIYSLEGLKYRTNLRLRDPVICTSNIYREEYDLRNGSMGVIVEIYNTPKSFDIRKNVKSKIFVTIATYGKIRWDDGTDSGYITELPLEIIQSIQLAYGITVHKSQGSQFPRIIFAATKAANLDRTLVYTAITRASEHVVVMGDVVNVNQAIIDQPSSSNRNVGLGDFLDDVMGYDT